MSEIHTTEELITAIEKAPDFLGRKLVKLAPNRVFEINETIWIRRRIILEGQGSVLQFKGEGNCLKIGEDYSINDPNRPEPKFDSTLSTIRDLDILGDPTIYNPENDTGSGIGILCWSNGLRVSNVRFLYWKTGIEVSGSNNQRNSNNTVFRDLWFGQCNTALKYLGGDAHEGILDGCQIRSCQNGIELRDIFHMLFSGVYVDGTAKPIINSHDYSTWIGCSPDGAALSKDFKGGGAIVGGAMVSAARKIKAKGDRIGRGDSQLAFTVLNADDPTKGIRVFVPGEYNIKGEIVQAPIKFIQIENQNPPDGPNYEYHGIVYNPSEKKYYLGSQRFIPTSVPPYDPTLKIGAKWDVE
ncbi:hypothetical protein [uncultured Psychroserpens sp.]|uniref:hypothetical protein n=1 Tax=uncultured Psychroserpens sp. TaxID=255436 RepID=UPI00261197D3|nr:hypothetical protein [uncultured Psychroserpens sp.]